MKPAIITFTAQAAPVAARIAAAIDGETIACGPEGADARIVLPRLFAAGRPIIGICAAGILIRLLAPHLGDKYTEPPVLAVSADAAHVVPLLGGHRGANRLARDVAALLGATPALTTASESRFTRALDDPPQGYVLANPQAARAAMADLLNGAAIALDGQAPWLTEAGYEVSPHGTVAIRISVTAASADGTLLYHPRSVVAGVGAERGVAPAEVINLVTSTLQSANLAPAALAAIASVDLKADEAALHAAAAHFGVPLRLFSVAELDAERARLATPSAVVEAEIGTPGVAEAAALKAGTLLVTKQKSARATCAIGHAAQPIEVSAFGRAPGQLHIVGIGPGDARTRTASAIAALDAADDWVGYDLYLDLVADLHSGQQQHRFPLGDEEPRVRFALECAAEGRTVALICSGDAQIYAMASLVYELLAAEGDRAVSPAARRVGVESHPGISAMQAASARAGALLGHDFCAISLSDLLTPIATIRQRLAAAAAGDFVTALYNPRSQRRTTLLTEARELFLSARPAETPVVVASNLGRPAESGTLTTLSAFSPETVDMLTIVLIGASASRAFRRGDGRVVAYTPRGYAGKAAPE